MSTPAQTALSKRRQALIYTIFAGMMLALGLVLPFLTGQLGSLGQTFLPMHLPVLICGFVCGWPYGLAVGVITPLLRSLMFGMPPMVPGALAMAFELGAYGLFAGLIYRKVPRKLPFIYLTLILTMVIGRVVWAAATWVIFNAIGNAAKFTGAYVLGAAVLTPWPGILIQLFIVPLIVLALQKSRLIAD